MRHNHKGGQRPKSGAQKIKSLQRLVHALPPLPTPRSISFFICLLGKVSPFTPKNAPIPSNPLYLETNLLGEGKVFKFTNGGVSCPASDQRLSSLCFVSFCFGVSISSSAYLGETSSGNALKSLDSILNRRSLARGNEALSNKFKTNSAVLNGTQNIELSLSNGALHVLGLGVGDLVEGLDNTLTGLAEVFLGAGNGDGKETSIGVREVACNSLNTGEVGNGLGERASTGVPLDGGFTAEEVGKDAELGLGTGSTLRAGVGDHKGITSGVVDAVLTTEVLGGVGRNAAAGLEVAEELLGPLLELSLLGAGGNYGDVATLVDLLGVAGDGQATAGDVGDVLGGEGQLVGAQSGVEGNVVGGLERDGLWVVGEGVDLIDDLGADLLVELVDWEWSDAISTR